MAGISNDSPSIKTDLTQKDYKVDGTLTNANAEVSLVVGAASKATSFIQDKQYSLLWRDADLNIQGSLLSN